MPVHRRIESYPVDPVSIAASLQNDEEVIIQFDGPTYNPTILAELNELCAKFDSRLAIRFYGHYASSFDGNILLQLPNVKNLYVDCLTTAIHLDTLGNLPHLERLSIGVYELSDMELLRFDNLKNLTHLTIGNTKAKGFNLAYLKDFHRLHSLTISEQTRNIEKIEALTKLQSLTLSSIKKVPLDFVNQLTRLKSLELYLGGRENLHEIGENHSIENLVIAWVRGFNDLGNPARFRQLKTLKIEDNAQLAGIRFDEEMPYLEEVSILNCKTFSALSGLDKLSALNRLRMYKTNLDIHHLLQQPLPTSLVHLAFYTGKQKEDRANVDLLQQKGFKTDFHDD